MGGANPRFTDLPLQLVFGLRPRRLQAYENAPFFTIVNYEQMVRDALEVNERLRPEIVVLDEAQRIKNWSTKTAQAVKRLRSRYAFILTGTPIENRIDEIHSLMDFLDPSVLGPCSASTAIFTRWTTGAPGGVPQPRTTPRSHQTFHAPPPQGGGGDRAAGANRPESFRAAQRATAASYATMNNR